MRACMGRWTRWTAGSGMLVIGAFIIYHKFVEKRTPPATIATNLELDIPRPYSLVDDKLNQTCAGDGLASRIESSFRDVYLQLTSVIQGVALAFLASTTFSSVSDLSMPKWLAILTCLVVIIIVWQEYMVGATAFAWVPTILDSVIPFGLGVAEFAMIAFAVGSTQNFLIIFTIFNLLGTVAWGNCWFHARRGFAINTISYALLGQYVRYGFFGTALIAVVLSVLSGLSLIFSGSKLDLFFVACAFATTVPHLLHSIWHWNLPLRRQLT